ncbi:hypothetical protein ACFLZK_02395 [Patescibacteria group bacterium]
MLEFLTGERKGELKWGTVFGVTWIIAAFVTIIIAAILLFIFLIAQGSVACAGMYYREVVIYTFLVLGGIPTLYFLLARFVWKRAPALLVNLMVDGKF